MHYTAIFDDGTLSGELATLDGINVDVDHSNGITTRTYGDVQSVIRRAVSGSQLHDMIYGLVPYT